jgi:hypothetical protein
MLNWRIYYGDGSTFDNTNGPPEAAPCGGVQFVAYNDEDNRPRLCHDKDYYIFEDGRWFGVDAAGFWQYMGEPGFKVVKFGRMIGDLKFREIAAFCFNDLPVERAGK